MFSIASVYLSICGEGGLLCGDHYPGCIASDLTAQTPGTAPLLVKSGDQDWKPVQICSLEEPPLMTSGGCPLKF